MKPFIKAGYRTRLITSAGLILLSLCLLGCEKWSSDEIKIGDKLTVNVSKKLNKNRIKRLAEARFAKLSEEPLEIYIRRAEKESAVEIEFDGLRVNNPEGLECRLILEKQSVNRLWTRSVVSYVAIKDSEVFYYCRQKIPGKIIQEYRRRSTLDDITWLVVTCNASSKKSDCAKITEAYSKLVGKMWKMINPEASKLSEDDFWLSLGNPSKVIITFK